MDLFGRKAKRRVEDLEKRIELLQLAYGLKVEDLRKETLRNSDLRIEVARLEERLRPFEQPAGTPMRLYKSEDEEEAEYAYEHGHIDREEYARLMRQLGFENTDVDLAPEVSDIIY